MVPMLYDWAKIEREAAAHQQLFFRDANVYASRPEQPSGEAN
jgi:hypothetical protein